MVKVEPGTDGKSYTIYFSDDTKAVIANGEDGVAGKDAPVIGVKEEDGVYYWAQTIDGKTTILEVDGQKLRVTAEVTPPGCRSTKRVTGWRAMTAEIRGSGSRMPRASR